MKKILFLVFIVFLKSQTGFNVVASNEIGDMSNFTFNEFQNTAREGNHYVSTFKDKTFKFNFKAKLKIIDVTVDKVLLQLYEDRNGKTIDDGRELAINRNNYKAFRDVFSMYRPFEFKTAFPVKFYKVMTKTKAAGIEFYDSPQKGKKIKDDQIKVAAMTYFCYGHYKSGGDDYVLLSTRNYLAKTGNLSDLLGWVKIKDNDERISAVLWNTNLGLRPNVGGGKNISPIVFEQTSPGFKSAKKYIDSYSLFDDKDIIVDESALEVFNNRYKEKDGRVLRWLPMYEGLEDNDEPIFEVGITGEMADLRQDMLQFMNLEELQIAFILDGSGSMTYVWKNLPNVLISIIEELTNSTEFINAAKQKITPKIKIYYYKGHGIKRSLYQGWISNEDELNERRISIQNFQTESTPQIRVHMSQTVEYVLNDIGNQPTYICVMGDASDKDYPKTKFETLPQFKEKIEETFFALRGIKINSIPPAHEGGCSTVPSGWSYSECMEYNKPYKEFENHFPVIYTATDIASATAIPKTEINEISTKISDAIIGDIKQSIQALVSAGSSNQYQLDKQINLVSPFSQAYLRKISKVINASGSSDGTYFESGLIVAKDENGNLLLDIDVIVEERKLHELNSVILDFTSTAIESEARTMVKKIISIFFNQDFFDIDDEFLEETTLEDLWIKIVGDRKVADYLMPTLFTTNFTFKELLDNIEEHMPQLLENSNVISGLISQNYIEDNKNSVQVEVNFETHEAELLYWVNNEHLKLFKGINISD